VIYHRVAGTWEEVGKNPDTSRFFRLADGTLCFSTDDVVWALEDDLLTDLFRVPDEWWKVIAVAGPSREEIWILTDRRLGLFDGVAVQPVLIFGAVVPFCLVYDAEYGLLLSGSHGLFQVSEDGTSQELTPLLEVSGESRAARLEYFIVAAPGVWYARDYNDTVLRHLAGRWEVLTGENSFLSLIDFSHRGAPGLVANEPGAAFLARYDRLIFYDDPALR
jgi:hypothetical protein